MTTIHIVIGCIVVANIIYGVVREIKNKYADFDTQLKVFNRLGFVLNSGVTKKDIICKWGEQVYKKNPYRQLYEDLGTTVDKEPYVPITDQLYSVDAEMIENNGDYVHILDNLKRISRGEMDFKNISDVIDFDNEKASVNFELNGDKYDWDLKFDNDWIDSSLFTRIVELTKKYKTEGMFTYLSGYGQDFVLGYLTPAELRRVRRETKLDIKWLN